MLPLLGLNSYPITCYYIPVLMEKKKKQGRETSDHKSETGLEKV